MNFHLESQDNYDEDFNSTASASVKEDPVNQETDSDIEEELGVDDLLSSASGVSKRLYFVNFSFP